MVDVKIMRDNFMFKKNVCLIFIIFKYVFITHFQHEIICGKKNEGNLKKEGIKNTLSLMGPLKNVAFVSWSTHHSLKLKYKQKIQN